MGNYTLLQSEKPVCYWTSGTTVTCAENPDKTETYHFKLGEGQLANLNFDQDWDL